jgi:riboflavin transporter FmnP
MDLKNTLLLIGGFAILAISQLLPVAYSEGEGFLVGVGIALIAISVYKAITQFIKQRKESAPGKIIG